jgi:hypothetical protein
MRFYLVDPWCRNGLAALVGLAAAPLPTTKTRRRRALIATLVVLGMSAPLVTLVWAQRYDGDARIWAAQLGHLAPARRVLVLANPPTLPADVQYRVIGAAQIFDPGNPVPHTRLSMADSSRLHSLAANCYLPCLKISRPIGGQASIMSPLSTSAI